MQLAGQVDPKGSNVGFGAFKRCLDIKKTAQGQREFIHECFLMHLGRVRNNQIGKVWSELQ